MATKNDIARQCALTRQTRPAEDLIRFVAGPDDVIVPDVDARAPGRGVWISLDFASVAKAAEKNCFSKSLRHQVRPAPDLANLTKTRLEQRLTGALGLARKAGQIVLGTTKIGSALNRQSVIAILSATDGAADGKRKIAQAARGAANKAAVARFELLTAEQMSLALGAQNVVHAALLDGPAGQAAKHRALRLARYMNLNPDGRDDRDATI